MHFPCSRPPRCSPGKNLRRWRTVFAVLTTLGLGTSSTPAAPPGWVPTWSDEFDGTTLDTTKWDPILWLTPYNNERQAYHPSRVTVADGHLVLTADNTPLGGKAYTSGKVESKITQQFGRWEIRAKLPGTRGTWPAIWLLPDTTVHGWPTQGEIDILENRGTEPHLTSSAYHYGGSVAAHQYKWGQQRTSVNGVLSNYHNDFHVYAVEWDADKLRFFVDDVNYLTLHNQDVGGFLSSTTAEMETVLNVAVGGDFLGTAQPNSSSVWPQQMLVDYVRVYERAENPPPVVFRNPGFDEAGGGLAGWSTFGNTLAANPNVQVAAEAHLDGSGSLKLFGQSIIQENYSGVSQGITVVAGNRVEADVNAFIRSGDSIVGTNNDALLKIEFYRKFGGKYGSADMISELVQTVADGSSPQDVWLPRSLSTVAPNEAVEARVVLLFRQRNNGSGAVHFDEVRFENLDLAMPADANGDGTIDGADFLQWQRGYGSTDATAPAVGDFNFDGRTDGGDLALWHGQFGGPAPVGAAASAVVAEPSTAVLAIAALIGIYETRLLLSRHTVRAAGP
ncbi:MAG: family 16 glycosylhydrolase [Pirellulales bacterium]|nr:family 16 glycosylhydrolase [Pirellulales bacterium]